jgi:methionine synthase II (cobalamin-independent)
MRRSTDRLLTTHTGGLPRPEDLLAMLAGRDCGFATFGRSNLVEPETAGAKLAVMAEGARLASAQLWR